MIWSYQESASNWNMWRPSKLSQSMHSIYFFFAPHSDDYWQTEFKLTKSTPCSCWQKEMAPELAEDPLWTQLGRAVETPYHFHSHSTKKARRHEHFLWKMEMCRRQQQTREMKHKTNHPMPITFQIFHIFKCPSLLVLTLFSCDFPCSISSFRRAHLLSDCFFTPPTLSTCPERISWEIKIIHQVVAAIHQVVWSCS